MKILGVSGSLTGEKTSIGVYEALMAIKAENPEAETELLDLTAFRKKSPILKECEGANRTNE
ncbi:hypothetical protein [Heyndrickxia coagulans]|uniref:hypothetical protein n=1 Tax=Heyndrickxia coagulans TaxID=1398 RepID=UPI002E23E4C1|nr:hypothetical protein [Heyndrickxia coagulans]